MSLDVISSGDVYDIHPNKSSQWIKCKELIQNLGDPNYYRSHISYLVETINCELFMVHRYLGFKHVIAYKMYELIIDLDAKINNLFRCETYIYSNFEFGWWLFVFEK